MPEIKDLQVSKELEWKSFQQWMRMGILHENPYMVFILETVSQHSSGCPVSHSDHTESLVICRYRQGCPPLVPMVVSAL